MPRLDHMAFSLRPRIRNAAIGDHALNLIAELVEADQLLCARVLAAALGFELIHRPPVRSRPMRLP